MTWPRRNARSARNRSRHYSQVFRRRVMKLNALSRLERENELESTRLKEESLNKTDPII